MIQGTKTQVQGDLSGGLVTLPNLLALPPNASPNCMDVKFDIGKVGKRAGSTTLNSVALLTSNTATGFSPDAGATLAVGLTAYWKLDETTGARLDSFGSNTLTNNNAVTSTAGVVGNAAFFSMANSQYLSASSAADLNLGTDTEFTISAWVALSSKATAQAIVAKWVGTGGLGGDIEYLLRYRPDADRFSFEVANGTTLVAVSDSALGSPSTNTKYALFGWLNTATNLLYIQVNTLAANSLAYTQSTQTTSSIFAIGRAGDFPGQHFDGWIDEVGLWKRALTAQERIDLVNAGNGNSYNQAQSRAGYGSFDFGAGQNLRWHIVAAGTGIYASSNRGASYVVIATDRGANYQYFERSKNLLIATSETQNRVLYWAGSVGTFMLGMPAGSAPPVKHCLDFNGYTLLMNNSGGNKRVVYYNDNNTIATGPFSTTFEVPSSQDDEITGGIVFNTRAYIFTRYTTQQVSFVGGNPDFSVRQVKSWGAVPRTIKRVSFGDLGEVVICLGWDKKVRIFDGSDDRIVSAPIEKDNGLSTVYLEGLDTTNLHKCHAEVDTTEQVYKLWVVMAPSVNITHCLCLNLRTGAWYPYLNQNVNTAVMAESGNSRILTAVKQDGFVYQMDTGNVDLTTPIAEYYDSSYHVGSHAGIVTKRHNLALYFKPTSSGTLFYQDASDYARTFGPARDTILLTGASGTTLIRKVIDVPTTDQAYQFRLSSSGSTAYPWTLVRTELSGDPRGQT